MAPGGWACARSGGDTVRIPWTSLRRQSNPQRVPIFHAKVDSRFFSLQLHENSTYFARPLLWPLASRIGCAEWRIWRAWDICL